MNWFMQALQQYAQFSGRSRRKEYWFFMLFYFIFYIAASIVDAVLVGMGLPFPFITLLFSLGMLVPSVAVAIRRLHDTGRSGWWFLLTFVPIANIVLIVFLCLDSEAGDNQYGINPKTEVVL